MELFVRKEWGREDDWLGTDIGHWRPVLERLEARGCEQHGAGQRGYCGGERGDVLVERGDVDLSPFLFPVSVRPGGEGRAFGPGGAQLADAVDELEQLARQFTHRLDVTPVRTEEKSDGERREGRYREVQAQGQPAERAVVSARRIKIPGIISAEETQAMPSVRRSSIRASGVTGIRPGPRRSACLDADRIRPSSYSATETSSALAPSPSLSVGRAAQGPPVLPVFRVVSDRAVQVRLRLNFREKYPVVLV